MRTTPSALLTLLLAACAGTPSPMPQPDAGLPAAIAPQADAASADAAAAGAGGAGADTAPWRGIFADPALQRLTAAARVHNRDLRRAVLQVEMARVQLGIERTAQRPAVTLEAGAQHERGLAGDGAGAAPRTQQASLGLGLSAFELDLFGRVRAQSDAALARYLASAHGRRAAELALDGAVADAYLAQRLALAQRALAERTRDDWQQTLALLQLQRQAGQSSALDLLQAEGELALAEAELQARRRALDQAGNALRLLVGATWPEAPPEPLAPDAPPLSLQAPAGLPAQRLLRRPDLQQAEQLLAATQAEIAAARAALFPRITLTAALGVASPALDGLFSAGHGVWRLAPQASLPWLDGGRQRQEVQLAQLRRSEALAGYERSIQVALREVADALAAAATLRPQIAAQSRAVAIAERQHALTALRHRAGLDGRLELLDAGRRLATARRGLLELRHAELANAVALYLALGGDAPATAAP